MARFSACVLLLASVLSAQQSVPPSGPQPRSKSAAIESGAIRDGMYYNPWFGFSYKLPFGWVDRTRQMQDDSADTSKSLLLLAVFERPPEARGETINSAVVIAAERASIYSGMKTAADYFGPLTELTTAKGFQVINPPYDFPLGTTHLVRGDFSKLRGTLTMWQSSLVMLQKGYAVSFTFIGASEDEVNQLIEKLKFGTSKPRVAVR